LAKGLVGGREHRERALALQRVDQAGGLQRGGQGLELAGGTAVSTMSLAWAANAAAARAVAMNNFFMVRTPFRVGSGLGTGKEQERRRRAGCTRSITWITPLLASTSVAVMRACGRARR
jgi:hypothetical protein